MANEAPERTLADVISTIEAGEFYQDYDQSSADLRILRATLSSDAVAGGEPVAWRLEDRSHPGWFTYYDPEQEPPTGAEPLYAAPPETTKLQERVKELEKAVDQSPEFIGRVSGTALGIAMSGRNHPNPGDVLTALSQDGILLADTLRTARRVREGGKVDG